MNKEKISVKMLCTLTVILLIFVSFNISFFSKAEIFIDKDDCIWLDDFGNEQGLLSLYNTEIKNGSIQNEKSKEDNIYDFSERPFNHKAFDSNLLPTFIQTNGGTPFFLKITRDLISQLEFIDYDGIEEKDDSELTTTESPSLNWKTTFSVMHHFSFKIKEEGDYIDWLEFYWHGLAGNASKIQMYAWKHPQNSLLSKIWRWDGEDEISATGDLQELNFKTKNASEFVTKDKTVDILIIVIPKDITEKCWLSTDYVSLSVNGKNNYEDNGNVTSVEIEPKIIDDALTNWQWDEIIWDGSSEKDKTSIKIQVLNTSNFKPIPDKYLSGNSKGFKKSPIDISSIPTDLFESISLHAILETNDLTFTPRLHSWGATWQKRVNCFTDNFSTDIRLDKLIGAEREDNTISISEYHSDWPVFGKDSDNNRVYLGNGPDKYKKYWYTSEGVGGLLCSPVLYKGKIFVPSTKYNRLMSFSATDHKGENPKINETNKLMFPVECSPAVVDDLVVIGTSATGVSNKIYAFNENNLSLKWELNLSKVDDEYEGNICFSSSPTIHNDKIFISSWSGNGLDTPLLNFLYNLIGEPNNRITAIDTSGNVLWSKQLPAASFSTPAVSDKKVLVGCENLRGGSLFAFEENTGKEIWNTSIGIIGRSSPVVYGDKVFVITKKQTSAFKWGSNLFAIDLESGNILWNITINDNITGWQNLPKDIIGFLQDQGFVNNSEGNIKMHNLFAATTPAVDNGIVYITSSDGYVYAIDSENGDIRWTFDINSTFLDIPTYVISSPIITDKSVYIVNSDSTIYSINKNNGKILWNSAIEAEEMFNIVVSSPIISNGLMYISTINNDNQRRLFSIGSYSENIKAKVYSNTIKIPNGYWWDTFKAESENTSGNLVSFSIVDENNKIMVSGLNGTGLNGNGNNLTNLSIKSSKIKLCAELKTNDSKNTPILHNWMINWKEEKTKPIFISDSFQPDPNGWIKTNKPICSIDVYDNKPGIDVDSARFKIEYISSDNDKSKTSDYYKAECSKKGSGNRYTIKADIANKISDLKIKKLQNIIFYIEDYSGNSETFQLSNDFKIDNKKPVSMIDNKNELEGKINTQIIIEASAEDDDSGIKQLTLKYQYKQYKSNEWSEWKIYNTSENSAEFSWYFADIENSGFYRLTTIATDKVDNIEEDSNDKRVEFQYDITSPELDTDLEDYYTYKDLKNLELDFSDDYELKKIEYRFNNQTDFNQIDSSNIEKINNKKWTLKNSFWDVLPKNLDDIDYILFAVEDTCGNLLTTDIKESVHLSRSEEQSKILIDLSDFSDLQLDDEFKISTDISNNIVFRNAKLYYRYSEDKDELELSDWTQYGKNKTSIPPEWNFKAEEGNGHYQFKIIVWDVQGDKYTSEVESAKVSIFPVIPIIIFLILLITIIILSIVLFLKIRKKKINA